MNLGRTQTALGAFYRRVGFRIGKAKAVTATARKLAILIYRTLKDGLVYADPGADAYDAQRRTHVVRRLRHAPKTWDSVLSTFRPARSSGEQFLRSLPAISVSPSSPWP